MMMMFEKPKFIVQNGELKMGRVVAHEELAGDNIDDVKGGGLWDYDPESDTLYLYAKSFQFGTVTPEDLKDVWVRPSLEKSTIYFSTEMHLDFAKQNCILIQDLNEDEANN